MEIFKKIIIIKKKEERRKKRVAGYREMEVYRLHNMSVFRLLLNVYVSPYIFTTYSDCDKT